MDISKNRSVINAFILSQSSYCPLIWMFRSRKLNHKINKIHELALRIVHNDHQCTFEELLERDNSFTIHERNLQNLDIEMFKVNNGLSVQLKLKHMANNLYHISDLKSGIPDRKKKKSYNLGSIQV